MRITSTDTVVYCALVPYAELETRDEKKSTPDEGLAEPISRRADDSLAMYRGVLQ